MTTDDWEKEQQNIISHLTRWLSKLDTNSREKRIANFLALLEQYKPHADNHFLTELCNGKDCTFAQRYWEMYLFTLCTANGLTVLPHTKKGPDIAIQHPTDTSRKIFIEAIAPTRGEGPNEIPRLISSPPDRVVLQDVPAPQILLRWTSAFKDKTEKFKEYRKSRIVSENDYCVIAINSCLWKEWNFNGISNYPAILEALYGVGPSQMNINSGETDKTYRPKIQTNNNSSVSTVPFLEDNANFISAVIAGCIDLEDESVNPLLIHNLKARNRISKGLLPVKEEYSPVLESGQVFLIHENNSIR